MAPEEHEVTLITCYLTTGHAMVRMADGRERLLEHRSAEYQAFEGRKGRAVIEGQVLIEFRPHPS